MRTKPQSSQRRMSWAGMLITLTLIILFGCSQKAFAQQWSTSGNDISNSNSGNVGVGTTSPGVKLDILSSVNLIARFGSTAGAHSQVLIDAPAAFNSNLTLQRGGVSKWYMGNRASNDRLSFIESAGLVETLTLLQNGNVGIGTINPGERLVTFGNMLVGNITSHTKLYADYNAQSPVIMELGYGTATAGITPMASLVLSKNLTSTNTPIGLISFANSSIADDNEKRLGGIAGYTDGALNSGSLLFATSNLGTFTERMRITSAGNVGIGTTSFNYGTPLEVAKPGYSSIATRSTDASGVIAILAANSSAEVRVGAVSNHPVAFYLNNLEKMRIDTAGNVGIGTNAPSTKLDVAGQIRSSTGGFKFPDGTVQITAATGGGGAVDSVFGRTGAVVAGNNDYTWAQINKSTSSLGDLQTRNAGDLNAGTVPIARLGVSGTPDATTFLRGDNTWATVTGGPSQWTTTSGTNNISYNSGNVGIGTTTPGAKLDVVGGAYNTGIRITSSSVNGSGLTIKSTDTGGHEFNILATATNIGGGAGGLHIFDATANAARMRISPNGNIGIGTLSPGYKLDVTGEIRSSTGGFVFPDGSVQTTAGGGAQSIFKNIANGSGTTQFSAGSINDSLRFEGTGGTSVSFDANNKKVIISSSTSSSTSSAPNVAAGQFGQFTGGGDYSFPANLSITGNLQGGSATFSTISGNGASLTNLHASNLVSGTVPIARLGSGTANSTTFLRGDNTWAAVPGGSSQWTTTGTNNIHYNTGNVGIGTTGPTFLLDVSGSTNNLFRVSDPTPNQPREYFATTTRPGLHATATVVRIADGRLIVDNTSPEGTNDTILRRAVNSLIFTPSEHPDFPGAFIVRQVGGNPILYAGQNVNGNVGIGTTTPGAKLEVVGNVNVTGTGNITAAGTIEGGNIKAKYQDVAEWVESSQELSAGTLVVLDHTKSNQVIASSQAYDTRVAGVISEKPGIALGEAGDKKVLVATTGRVMLTVDASKGPIQIGDLLVTSDIPGVAMKSEAINVGGVQIHRPGTLIGKALEPLAKGQGKILVLLSLQ